MSVMSPEAFAAKLNEVLSLIADGHDTVSKLARKLGVSRPTVAHRLGKLREQKRAVRGDWIGGRDGAVRRGEVQWKVAHGIVVSAQPKKAIAPPVYARGYRWSGPLHLG